MQTMTIGKAIKEAKSILASTKGAPKLRNKALAELKEHLRKDNDIKTVATFEETVDKLFWTV